MLKKVNLQKYIHPKMDILFVALNAPDVSNTNRHWFSRNLSFWNLLFKAGIITQRIVDPLEGDEIVFDSTKINSGGIVIGVTDLNRDDVETKSNFVQTSKQQVERILEIIADTKVKKICIMHSKVAKEFAFNGIIKRNFKDGKNCYGKVGNYIETEIFEVPFHNASLPEKEKYYKLLLGNDKLNNTANVKN
jgi:hypothetical protein